MMMMIMTVMAAAEDGVELGLETELAANRRQRASVSSSATWDSVSVDSLVIYDVDHDVSKAVQTAALYTARTEPIASRRASLCFRYVENRLNNFVNVRASETTV